MSKLTKEYLSGVTLAQLKLLCQTDLYNIYFVMQYESLA